MNGENELIELLRAVEMRLAGPDCANGEEAKSRIRARLQELEKVHPVEEFRLPMSDMLGSILFCALLGRYGLEAYRYRGQRRTSLMVKTSRQALDDVLMPLFAEMSKHLSSFVNGVTQRVVSEAVNPGPQRIKILPKPGDTHELCSSCMEKLEKAGPDSTPERGHAEANGLAAGPFEVSPW